MIITNSTISGRSGPRIVEISAISWEIQNLNFCRESRIRQSEVDHGPDRPEILEFVILIQNPDFEFSMKSPKFLPPSAHRTILGLRIQNYKNP